MSTWVTLMLYQGLLPIGKGQERPKWGSLQFAAPGASGPQLGARSSNYPGCSLKGESDSISAQMCALRSSSVWGLWPINGSSFLWFPGVLTFQILLLARMQKRKCHHWGQTFCFSTENSNAFCFIPLLYYLNVLASRINEIINRALSTVSGSQEALNNC